MSSPTIDPLSGVDDVPWHRLHDAYGPAAEVPGQLVALRSDDQRVRARALDQLYGNIYHQGTRWQVSAHAVPFLVALAADATTPDRAAVVGLLRRVAIGDLRDDALPFDADRRFAAGRAITAEQMAEVLERLYPDSDEYDDAEDWADIGEAAAVAWAAAAYDVAGEHTATYAAWLGESDVDLVAQAAELLAWYPATEPTVDALLRIPDDVDHAGARASANLTLAHVGWPDARITARLTASVAAASTVVARTAAVALAYRLGGDLPERALDVLTSPRGGDESVVPGWDRSLNGFVALAVRRLTS